LTEVLTDAQAVFRVNQMSGKMYFKMH